MQPKVKNQIQKKTGEYPTFISSVLFFPKAAISKTPCTGRYLNQRQVF
jgi:hypothetical protein